ncbi:MAG TPA: sialate O-acetylesterase [Chthoniobacteraceae bacterium]|jgi:hypothetical protein|nr:sialate O-acetylesterase [Chthoniobacteraceae bacterium]
MHWRSCLTLLCLLVTVHSGSAEPQPDKLRLFLLIGQSNMAGRARLGPEDVTTNPRIFMLRKDLTWALAKEPMHFDNYRAGVGPGSEFARAVLKANPKAKIGLIPCAVGGSTLASWKPGGPHYAEAVARTKVAMRSGKLACILWHQGEADCAPGQVAAYPAEFAAMIAQLRKDLETPDVPVIVGEIGHFSEEAKAFNRIIPKTAAGVPRCDFVTAEDLQHRAEDNVHFDTPSMHLYGARYADSYLKMDPPPEGKRQ